MKKQFHFFLYLLLVPAAAFSQNAVSLPKSKNKVVVIAHRGNHVSAPENTVAACREAIKCGADYVEVDLRTTKDGKLVVLHDATVDRTTHGSGRVADLTWAEVHHLQVFNRNKRPHRIPLFSEMLAACKGQINIYLDFKEANVEEAWRQIKAAGMEKNVIVYLNKPSQYEQWKAAAPQALLMTSAPENADTPQELEEFLTKTQVQVLDNVTDPEMLAILKKHEVQVWLDVQDLKEGPKSWQEALSKNVQGLQTDKPAELVTFLKAQP